MAKCRQCSNARCTDASYSLGYIQQEGQGKLEAQKLELRLATISPCHECSAIWLGLIIFFRRMQLLPTKINSTVYLGRAVVAFRVLQVHVRGLTHQHYTFQLSNSLAVDDAAEMEKVGDLEKGRMLAYT